MQVQEFGVEFKMLGGDVEYAVVKHTQFCDGLPVNAVLLAVALDEGISVQYVENSNYMCVKRCPDWIFDGICDALQAEGFKGLEA